MERTFRGKTFPKLVEVYSTSYKTDYQLIPKSEEANVCRPWKEPEEKVLPQHIEFPPLFRELITRETGQQNPQLKLKVKQHTNNTVRVAKDGETPTIQVTMGLGEPASPNLYKHILPGH